VNRYDWSKIQNLALKLGFVQMISLVLFFLCLRNLLYRDKLSTLELILTQYLEAESKIILRQQNLLKELLIIVDGLSEE